MLTYLNIVTAAHERAKNRSKQTQMKMQPCELKAGHRTETRGRDEGRHTGGRDRELPEGRGDKRGLVSGWIGGLEGTTGSKACEPSPGTLKWSRAARQGSGKHRVPRRENPAAGKANQPRKTE